MAQNIPNIQGASPYETAKLPPIQKLPDEMIKKIMEHIALSGDYLGFKNFSKTCSRMFHLAYHDNSDFLHHLLVRGTISLGATPIKEKAPLSRVNDYLHLAPKRILTLDIGLGSQFYSMAIHQKEQIAAVGFTNGNIDIIDLKSATTYQSFSLNSHFPEIAFANDKLVATTQSGNIQSWRLGSGELTWQFNLENYLPFKGTSDETLLSADGKRAIHFFKYDRKRYAIAADLEEFKILSWIPVSNQCQIHASDFVITACREYKMLIISPENQCLLWNLETTIETAISFEAGPLARIAQIYLFPCCKKVMLKKWTGGSRAHFVTRSLESDQRDVFIDDLEYLFHISPDGRTLYQYADQNLFAKNCTRGCLSFPKIKGMKQKPAKRGDLPLAMAFSSKGTTLCFAKEELFTKIKITVYRF